MLGRKESYHLARGLHHDWERTRRGKKTHSGLQIQNLSGEVRSSLVGSYCLSCTDCSDAAFAHGSRSTMGGAESRGKQTMHAEEKFLLWGKGVDKSAALELV